MSYINWMSSEVLEKDGVEVTMTISYNVDYDLLSKKAPQELASMIEDATVKCTKRIRKSLKKRDNVILVDGEDISPFC